MIGAAATAAAAMNGKFDWGEPVRSLCVDEKFVGLTDGTLFYSVPLFLPEPMIYRFITREWCSSSILYPPTRRKRSEEEQEIPPPPWNERTDISGQKDVAHSLHFLSLGCHLVERWKRRTRGYKSSSHFLMTSSNPLLTGRKKNTQEKEEVVCDPPTHRLSFSKFLKTSKRRVIQF